ncbi:hypothetical protein GQ42DRAFT_119201 [Ramicandelaber brevisporus]|nr:hypothetical protein GQ42DRAFT_119201 [Ramicandelaber brevisporus]
MAAVAGTGVRIEDVADPGSAADNSLLQLTKRLIEIQNILNTVNVSNEALKLPRIVVIGSQSSGKSSVLEAIVGHSFLPKGTNMVTRRPIELTLVHTPGATEEYGEFPQLGLGKVHDFSKIQSTLTDLNKAVPESECVSSVPIDLRIYSPNVPDLKLVDLPGYIQVTSRNQPTLLRDKIRQLCEQYIVEPNIILAVCAADVDLANSEALQASRRVDPLGMRTIGVVTKMDLVDAHMGTSILTNKDYPLHLGYIGVARKVAPVGGSSPDAAAEAAFFSAHKEYQRSDINVGFGTLRNKLVSVLEENMGRNLDNITDAVQMELEEARYQSKVLYNDQLVTAESYAADAIDLLKRQFRDFASSFGKEQVRQALDATFEQRILDICAEQYWSDPRINEISPERWLSSILSHERNHYWTHRLERSTSALTKSGVGRWSTQMVADAIMANVSDITEHYPLVHHPDTQKEVRQFAHELLRSKWHSTIDSVENTIKPLKYEIEVSQNEWKRGVDRATAMVQQELDQCQHALNNIKQRLGTSKLRRAVKYLIDVEKHKSLHPSLAASSHHTETEDTTHHSPYSPAVLDQARRAVLLRDRAQILQLRLDALQSKTCRTEENKSACPEAFLRVVADKLASSAVIFINVELLSDFYFQFPREVDRRLYFGLGRDQVREFALNNPRIAQQLELIDRTQKLELVMGHLRQLQSAKSRQQQQKQQQQQQPKQQQDSHAPQMQAQYMRSH